MPSADPLEILIVGAGIAGFSAAISCRRAGHTVHVYERSALNNELGAAIHVCPNASRGLLAWGMDPVRARFVTCKSGYRAKAETMVRFHETDETYVGPTFGAPWFLAHRVDLHEELKRLATEEGPEGKPVVVHLKSPVVAYDVDAGSIELANGSRVTGDLVVAADGVHSIAVEAVLGAKNPALPTTAYNFAYRFLIPSKELAVDPETAHFLQGDDGRMKFLVGDGKRIVWYPCRNNEEQNFVAIFCSNDQVYHEDWQTAVDKSELLKRYSDFHPSVLAVLKKAHEVKQWPLLFRAPIATWHKSKVVLIGDAAHPMLPHQGQGGAQAIEDAVTLGMVLTDCDPAALESRLQLFEEVRKNRASVMQIFSNAGQDEPQKIQKDAAAYIPADKVPKTPEDFFKFNFGYDVVKATRQAMEREVPGWTLPENFFTTTPGEGIYP